MSYYTALEDLFEDVVGKSLRGQGLAQRDVEQRSGLKAGDLARITGAGFVPDDARIVALANILGLHGQRLVDSARCAWFPKNPDGAIGNARIGVDMLVVDGMVPVAVGQQDLNRTSPSNRIARAVSLDMRGIFPGSTFRS